MGSDKGGSADNSGMMEAMVSAQAAQQAYQLGTDQLNWTKTGLGARTAAHGCVRAATDGPCLARGTVPRAVKPRSRRNNIRSMRIPTRRWNNPMLPKRRGGTLTDVQAIANARGAAMSDVAEQGQAGLNTAAETLRSYGINPGSGRYASLYTGAQPMLAASEAAAGTTAAQNLRLQKMGLEAGAIDTGRGLVNSTSQLASTGTGAGTSAGNNAQGAAGVANANLSTGSTAMTNPSQWFNAGTNAMNSYVGAVKWAPNTSNAQFFRSGRGRDGAWLSAAP